MNKQEKNNDRTAWTVSILVHALLLIAFIFMVAWREPNPPLPEYGIQINFGTDDVGSGDIQPTQPANTSESEEEDATASDKEVVEEEDATASDTIESEETIEEVVEDISSDDIPEEIITQDAPSPDVIEEEVKPKEIIEDKKEEEKPVEQPIKEEVVKEERAKAPVLYENKDTNANDGTGESGEAAQKANEGDDEGETGDKGQEDGVLDEKSIYKGNQGGGGGTAELNMLGWNWDSIPRPDYDTNESGRVTFEVKIDDEGEILSVRTLVRGVNADIEKIYRQEIEKLTFTKSSDNRSTAAISTGTITFVIKSK